MRVWTKYIFLSLVFQIIACYVKMQPTCEETFHHYLVNINLPQLSGLRRRQRILEIGYR